MIPSVYIIVLNWNGKTDTLACLASLYQLTYPNFNVLLVDNASSDGSEEAIRSAHPWIDVIQSGANLGFSGGNNVGIQRALEQGADYILLLNNDTEVDPCMLGAFVEAAQRYPDAGALSARIYFHEKPERLWYAGAKWVPNNSRFTHIGWGKLDKDGDFATEGETDYACGCAFFASAERWREVGLLDDTFFLTFEETDWCYRAHKAGHPSIYVPSAKLWHKISVSFGGAESPLAQYYMTRNRLLWAKRHLNIHNRYILWLNLAREVLPNWNLNKSPGIGLSRQLWWSFAEYINIWRKYLKDPIFQAKCYGVHDYLLGRFGQQAATLKKIKRI